ncbi:LOW QUALITY PROTEIN: 2-oxoglutarate-Fe(II) type oxidoreductase hxnY-like [Eucalyptus grandis]|uniref:LOW QUALITY PROTEIN: 2-oxoglutarate-Fe(II) type oxidoreductase hxnY-like n=1 Tax=Eucalyptus grandis TaxID=71139 RepID=UPI00192EC8BA|nr:LOW QUALITY PROTEIN: 2-oxoglutarate-Fe(II) type oxidoreductase hxnY-like [Eucalyptus grandis]
MDSIVAGVSPTGLNQIDLSSSDLQRLASLVKQACTDSGFFYVINHGISQDLMDELFSQSRQFFDLPLTEKMKLLRNAKNRGYSPLFDQTLDPPNQKKGDYREGYFLGVDVPEYDPNAQKPDFGPNVWPSEDILPGWRQTMQEYHSQALNVAKLVARVIAIALDLEADFFEKPEIFGEPIADLRLLHYEGVVFDPSEGIYGTGAHTDFGFLTLLATDAVSGLQICKNKDAKPQIWEYVPPMKGAFIVNIGDMLERWSNCIFRSTLHRVIGNGQERYSVPFFMTPNHDCLVQCLPTCTSEENPPKFPPVLCQTYLSQRLGDILADLKEYKREGE